MPIQNNQLGWLLSQQNILLSEIQDIAKETSNPLMADALSKLVEAIEIGQQIQNIYAFHLLSSLKQSEHEIDDQLNEIAGYMESIVLSRQREAENLRKVQ